MKKEKLPKPIAILVLTLLTTLLWVSLDIYRSLTVKPSTIIATDVSKSLTPSLNMDVLQKIDSAIYIPDSEIPPLNIESSIVVIPIPKITPEPVTEATQSASPSAQI